MTKHLWLLLAPLALSLAAGCGGSTPLVPTPDTSQDMSPVNDPTLACEAAGGSCVAVYPGTCADGKSIGADKCGGGVGVFCCVPGATPVTTCTPLLPSGGSANPASSYCSGLGYQLSDDGKCLLPGGEQCDAWAFYRGECGHRSSFCEKQGGTISHESNTTDGTTTSYGVCSLPDGKKCSEEEFSHNCACK